MKMDDLMKGMNHIDDDLLEEAREPMEHHADIEDADKENIDIDDTDMEKVVHFTNSDESRSKSRKSLGRRITAIGTAFSVTAAAILAVVVVNQNMKINRLEEQMNTASAESEDSVVDSLTDGNSESTTVGLVSSDTLGDSYTAASDYGQIYDMLAADTVYYDNSVISRSFENEVTYESAAVTDKTTADKSTANISSEEGVANAGLEDMSGDYSSTNVVTEGVDESDIVKTDGSFIYQVLSGSVEITDIRDGEPGESVRLTPPFTSPSDVVTELYVDGESHRLLIIASHVLRSSGNQVKSEETYVYSYDITDPMNAQLIGSMHQDGGYHTSRKIGNTVYLFTDQYIYLTGIARETAISETGLQEWAPAVNGTPIDCKCIYLPENGTEQLIISSFDVDEPDQAIDAKCILTDYENEYITDDAIYLYSQNWVRSRTVTEIDKLNLEDGKISAGPSTTLSGYINDTFALNDNGTYLRVLTTDNSGSTDVSILYILDKDLKQVGRLDEIARGEDIYAARFIGNTVYFITYENTDPLFVADLSDPANPVLLGSVEISGFSDYLHIWDDTHVLGIGYETNEDTWTNYVKLVMFDVSDPANPKVEHTKILREANYSNALDNYKAMFVQPGRNLIGFAAENYNTNDCDYYLFSYDSERGFVQELDENMTYNGMSGYRGLYSGDWFYIAGNGEIKAYDRREKHQK